jgi:hypothetical protein
MDVIQELGEFATVKTQLVAGTLTRGKGVLPKSQSIGSVVASDKDGHPMDFLDNHTDEKVCPFSREEKQIMREDSELIVGNTSLRHLFQREGLDGLVEESEMINKESLIACIAEKSYVEQHVSKLKLTRVDEVAFDSWDQVDRYMPFAKFTELAKSRVNEFKVLQERDNNIRTLKLLTI